MTTALHHDVHPRESLNGIWQLAEVGISVHTATGSHRATTLEADGRLRIAPPDPTTVDVRLRGVSSIRSVGFDLSFDAAVVHGDGRAGSLAGSLHVARATVPLQIWFELQAVVEDGMANRHAIFTTECPLGVLGVLQPGYAALEFDFVQVG